MTHDKPGASAPTPSVPAPTELRYKVQFTADQAYVNLLEEARNLLQHELPGRELVASPGQPNCAPARPAPVAAKSARQSRYIPAAVRRVWQRDEARCTYVDLRGQRCREQAGLEFHHQQPHARGGPPSVDNLALRCRSHNTLAAEQDFGRELIREKRSTAG